MKKFFKYFKRVLVAIPLFFINIIFYIIVAFDRTIMFIRYGGEIINYDKNEKATIQDIYDELKEQRDGR